MDTTTDAAFEVEAEVEQFTRRQEQDRNRKTATNSTATERTALLSSDSSAAEEDDQKEDDIDDFAGFPWYRRPSIFWVLGPFFLMTLAFGGVMAPKINLQRELVCREYFADRHIADPNFPIRPIHFNDETGNDQCFSDPVVSRASMFQLYASLIAGLLAAVASPKLGAWSDQYGRKPILIVTSLGAICGETITIIAASYPESFPVKWLLLAYAIDGMTGSFIVSIAMANSYAADCTPPIMRNKAFAYFHGCLFCGIAIGPFLAGWIVKETGKIVNVFYILLGVHCFFVLFVAFIVPESVSKRRQQLAQSKHELSKGSVYGWNRNIIEPLRILHPTGPGSSSTLRMNLLLLSSVDTIVFGVAMGASGVLLLYVGKQFEWQSFESGRFISIVNACRVFCLLVVLPVMTRVVRGKGGSKKQNAKGSDLFDLSIIRAAVFFDFLGYLGYTLARNGHTFTLSGVIAAIGGIGSPALQSSLTRHVPSDRTGQLLGAMGMLHALSRVVAPTIFNAIFAATVGKFNQTVFVCLAATFGIAFILTWFIRPHVYFDDNNTTVEADESRPA